MADELLRVVELDGRRYAIRHGDTEFEWETWWQIGHIHNGSQQWHASFGLYLPGKPVGHTTELGRHVAELREAERARAIAEARARWEQR